MSLLNPGMPKVLVLFKEAALAQVIEYNLTREGFAVTTLPATLEGAGSIREHPSDAVLLQLQSPSEEVLRACLECRQGAGRVRIMVLGPDDPSNIAAAFAAGVDDWLTTPF